MLIDISPIKKYKDYRYLFIAQSASIIGNMCFYVAVPFQVYSITQSNLFVALISFVQLVAVSICSLAGGIFADRLNRRGVMIASEWVRIGMLVSFAVNSLLSEPSVLFMFISVAVFQGVSIFHRPAMTALIQYIVDSDDFKSASSLGILMWSVGAIIGPALGGLLIVGIGFSGTYAANIFAFLFALYFLHKISKDSVQRSNAEYPVFLQLKEGFQFIVKTPALIGSYLVEFSTMFFITPVILFPAMSQAWGGARAAGLLYSGMGIGALLISLSSAWTHKITHDGRAVVISSFFWAICIFFLGFAQSLYEAVGLLILAGAANAVSGIFRQTIWNRCVPNDMRGRLSGMETIAYKAGPLLGGAGSGYIAHLYSVNTSLIAGSIICFVLVSAITISFPKFWDTKEPLEEV